MFKSIQKSLLFEVSFSLLSSILGTTNCGLIILTNRSMVTMTFQNGRQLPFNRAYFPNTPFFIS